MLERHVSDKLLALQRVKKSNSTRTEVTYAVIDQARFLIERNPPPKKNYGLRHELIFLHGCGQEIHRIHWRGRVQVREFAFVTIFHSTFYTIPSRPLAAATRTDFHAHQNHTSPLRTTAFIHAACKGSSTIILSVSQTR